jgi:hypothetical protein
MLLPTQFRRRQNVRCNEGHDEMAMISAVLVVCVCCRASRRSEPVNRIWRVVALLHHSGVFANCIAASGDTRPFKLSSAAC